MIRYPSLFASLPGVFSSRTPLTATLSHNTLALSQKRFNVQDLRPNVIKVRKTFKGFFKLHDGGSLQKTTPKEGDYALVASQGGRLKDIQIDNARTVIRRTIKPFKGAKFFIASMPDTPFTAKGSEARMGKGKGAVDYWGVWLAPGQTIMEVQGVSEDVAHKALKNAGQMFGIRTHVIKASEDASVPKVVPWFIRQKLGQLEFQEKGREYDEKRNAATNV